jgi:hypothetical protein
MVADRGQLLLVGAILFSVVVVGIVVQLNGLQYTDTAASDGQTGAIDRAAQTEAETRDALAGLVTRVRADTDRDEFGDALRENVSTYQNTSLNMTAARGATYTNVSVNETASVNESVVTQGSGKYRSPKTNDQDWTLANDSDSISVFWLNATKKTGNPNTDVTIVGQDEEWKLRLEKASGDDFDVETWNDTSGWTEHCTDESSVDLNLVTPSTGDCEFTPFDEDVDAPYNVTFARGNNAEGGYRIGVVGGLNRTYADPDEEGIYAPAIDFQYRSTSTAYNRTFVLGGGGS